MNAFVVGLAAGVFIAYILTLWFDRRRKSKFLAVCEYWVYIPGEKLPKQDDIMSLVLQGNSPVGPQEGLLFSDIRLHIALILRSKNPHVFRPDLFDEHIEPTAELLEKMAESQAVVKIRYLSESPLKSDAHLQLLPYLAYAYCKLADGLAVFDVNAERLFTREELQSELRDSNARRPELHLNTVWHREPEGGHVETRGMIKKGLAELVSADVHSDERLLVSGLIEEAAKRLWTAEQFQEQVEVESFSDLFRLILSVPKDGKSTVRILRVQSS
ncbi:MAG TPA: hypothetical protein VJ835_06540 [Fimbriimonadaceae bacterium]|nr:hypothetical protein [Fimbriimonadaceae bacterium]